MITFGMRAVLASKFITMGLQATIRSDMLPDRRSLRNTPTQPRGSRDVILRSVKTEAWPTLPALATTFR